MKAGSLKPTVTMALTMPAAMPASRPIATAVTGSAPRTLRKYAAVLPASASTAPTDRSMSPAAMT